MGEFDKELSDMLSDIPILKPVEPAEPTEPVDPMEPDEPIEPVEPVEPVTEPVTEPIVEPVTEPVSVVTPAPTSVEPVSELTEREKALLARIESLTGEKLSVDQAVVEPVAPTVPTVPVTPATPAPVVPAAPVEPEVPNFLGNETLDAVLDDPVKFNALLASVYQKGIEAAKVAATENVLVSLPQLVTSYVTRHVATTKLVENFYENNPDLVNVKKTVAAVANEIAAENPGMDVGKVFEETAAKTRRILNLPTKVVAPAVPAAPGPTPAFAKQNARSAPSTSGLKGLQKEVNDLLT